MMVTKLYNVNWIRTLDVIATENTHFNQIRFDFDFNANVWLEFIRETEYCSDNIPPLYHSTAVYITMFCAYSNM